MFTLGFWAGTILSFVLFAAKKPEEEESLLNKEYQGISGEIKVNNRYPRPKGRGSLIFAQNLLHPRSKDRGFFAQNKEKSGFSFPTQRLNQPHQQKISSAN